jgi:hypothetical protein
MTAIVPVFFFSDGDWSTGSSGFQLPCPPQEYAPADAMKANPDSLMMERVFMRPRCIKGAVPKVAKARLRAELSRT